MEEDRRHIGKVKRRAGDPLGSTPGAVLSAPILEE